MKKLLIIFVFIFSSNVVFGQCNDRYINNIFNSFSVTTVNYSDVYLDSFHEMDIYTPDNDTVTNRPVIIFIHGGSFMGGDKLNADCNDFCESFVKKGYVTVSVNYRLAVDPASFLLFQEEQYKVVLKSVADVKSAIRYLRKDAENGNNYGIDKNTIFVGGSSAGAITAIHLAYIDLISDLPTNPINVQTIVNTVGGANGLEGDAGNNGYSSSVSGVISFAGGINDVNWIDANDEPLVSIQGDADQTVIYNCGPGLGIQTIMTLCGSAEMHSKANSEGLINDFLLFPGAEHDWFPNGNSDPKFIQALDFTANFLYPLLPCNQATNINNNGQDKKRKKIQTIDLLGKKSNKANTGILLHIYDDGSVSKEIVID